MSASTSKYAFIDFGHDGVNELAFSFESTNSEFMNRVGIIKYNGDKLELNYYYEDGYRTFSNLYVSGYLVKGGAISASGNTFTVVEFDEKRICLRCLY